MHKHNLSPIESLLSPPILSPPTYPVGTKTQRCQEDDQGPRPSYRGSYKKVAEVPSGFKLGEVCGFTCLSLFFLQHLLARWLNDNPPAEEKLQQGDGEVEAPVQNSDVATLASVLNSLPNHPRSSQVITTPKRFVPFCRPSIQERRHPLQVDGHSGCNKTVKAR